MGFIGIFIYTLRIFIFLKFERGSFFYYLLIFTEKLVNVPQDLDINNLGNKIHSPYDFRFVFLASPKESTVKERGFFLGKHFYFK